jgi:NtrC-family two-component system response regulator AlgB
VIEPAAFPERIVGGVEKGPRLGGDYTVEEVEREHIERVVQRSANLEDAARILGIDSSTLWRKRKKYGQ